MDHSTNTFIKFSGPNGIDGKFTQALHETILARIWEVNQVSSSSSAGNLPRIKQRSGIGGIEKSLQDKQKLADANITEAFQDLKKLMNMAKEMVSLSKNISVKIRDRQSEGGSEDETIKFKSCLMSLGIDDPVTKDSFASNSEYLKSLGNEICQTLLDQLTVCIKLYFI